MKYMVQNLSIRNIAMAVLFAVIVSLLLTQPALGQSLAEEAQRGVDDTGGSSGSINLTETIENVIGVLLFAVGIISVIMIVVGGIRYAVSGGDANATKGARDTILYAVIGLVVSFVAWGIVNFVVGAFS
jgi:hypothetical protein